LNKCRDHYISDNFGKGGTLVLGYSLNRFPQSNVSKIQTFFGIFMISAVLYQLNYKWLNLYIFILFVFFEPESCCVAQASDYVTQASLELEIFLPHPPKC
jgi:hypothetical protein